MEAQRYEKYAELLRVGFGPITCAVPAFIYMSGDVLVVMAWNPEAGDPGGVALVNRKLLDNAAFQERFRERLRCLYPQLVEEMEAADMDLVQIAIAYFAGAMDLGHIDPQCGPLTEAVSLSSLEGWKAEAIASYVYREHIDGKQVEQAAECGSQQQAK